VRKVPLVGELLKVSICFGPAHPAIRTRRSVTPGYVRPNSEIELLRGSWGTLNDLEGREAILKSLNLTKARVVPEASLATILVGRPIRGTISRWPNAKQAIRNMKNG
jgi:hypothetical protein